MDAEKKINSIFDMNADVVRNLGFLLNLVSLIKEDEFPESYDDVLLDIMEALAGVTYRLSDIYQKVSYIMDFLGDR